MDYSALRFDEDQTRRFLTAILIPGHCFEIRILKSRFHTGSQIVYCDEKAHQTLGGWYNRIDLAVCDLARVKGVSAYVTVNPVSLDALDRSKNTIKVIGGRERPGTSRKDISFVHRFYIDIDSIRSPGISATDAERQHAIDIRDKILADYPFFREAAIWGTSGNGAWILVTAPDYPPDEIHQSYFKRALYRLKKEYSNDYATVDTQTNDPNRIMVIPGTWKCKGKHSTERPWRLATVDSPADHVPAVFDLIPWLGPEDVEEPITLDPDARPRHRNPFALPVHNLTLRAASYLAAMAPAIAGQHGHNQTFDAACALVKGFNFTPEEAYPFLAAWNTKCQPPWSPHELVHKLTSADAKADPKPRGYLISEDGWADAPPISPVHFEWDGAPTPPTPTIEIPSDRSYATPHDLARNIIEDHHIHPDGFRIRYWNEDMFVWDGYSYKRLKRGDIDAKICGFIESQFKEDYSRRLIQHTFVPDDKDDKKAKPPQLKSVTKTIVGDVTLALKSIILLPMSDHPVQPAWLTDSHSQWDPTEILPTRSGLIHLPSLIADKEYFAPLTPNFFGRYCLGYAFDPDAPTPHLWLKFLDQLWPGDAESKALLQEWMGYLLTPDTSMQKMAMLIGPPRSGKGTIARIITKLMGLENVSSPTLGQLSNPFGTSSLVGKQVAIVGDARITGRNDTAAIVEKLLSISGEDLQEVNRKYKEELTLKLETRFMIISNELPNLRDQSGAFASRMLIMQLRNTFLDKEDTRLSEKLLAELPGILRWAIDGWLRLRRNEHFTVPESSRGLTDEYRELTSPIKTFVADNCILDPEASTEVSYLYQRWCEWCSGQGIENHGDKQRFGSNLKSAYPKIEKRQKRDGGRRIPHYFGIRLMSEIERTGDDGSVEFTYD